MTRLEYTSKGALVYGLLVFSMEFPESPSTDINAELNWHKCGTTFVNIGIALLINAISIVK